MTLITMDLSDKANKKAKYYMIDNDIKTKAEAINKMLEEHD